MELRVWPFELNAQGKGLTRNERDALNAANEKLHHIIAVLRRARFGRKFEELETGSAKAEAEEEQKDLKRGSGSKTRSARAAARPST